MPVIKIVLFSVNSGESILLYLVDTTVKRYAEFMHWCGCANLKSQRT